MRYVFALLLVAGLLVGCGDQQTATTTTSPEMVGAASTPIPEPTVRPTGTPPPHEPTGTPPPHEPTGTPPPHEPTGTPPPHEPTGTPLPESMSTPDPTAQAEQAVPSMAACPDDFTGWFTTFPFPDLSVIYEVGPPGRIVDGDDGFKGHGYFRVPDSQNQIEVRMPINATLVGGAHYLASGEHGTELQYILTFQTACEGLWFLFDHIREPIPAIADLFTWDPPLDDTRGHDVGPLEMKEGDLVATSIGFLSDGNAFMDFGINDELGRLPTPQHPKATGRFGTAVCIYTFFDPEIAAYLRSVEHPRAVVDEGLCPAAS